MLYRIDLDVEPSSALQPLPFYGMSAVEKFEKDLEDVIAKNLEDVLFEETSLLPIHQERQGQGVADLYAVNPYGDLVLFELKRGTAGEGAIQQLLRYSQEAGGWRYDRLDGMYREYLMNREEEDEPSSLREAHGDCFGLEESLHTHEFNQDQYLRVIGNAADEELVKAVDYWKQHGLKIDFVPYRLYKFRKGGAHYFEFFSLPYDRHLNPGNRKGVLFDTNASYNTESVWEMMEDRKVAAYGGAKKNAQRVSKRDIVFFYHKGMGIVAAGEVTSDVRKVERDGYAEWYRNVSFLTPVPDREEGIRNAVAPGEIEKITEKSFWWARTIKRPHLDADEAQDLLAEVQERLG